jgi:MoxR-like ATPase
MLYTQLLREKLSQLLSDAATLTQAADRLASEDDVFFSERFLLPRPLLQAILSDVPTTLLIDEIDRADAEFEAFLLEVLSDFQVSVPELGTIKAKHQPLVLLTSNNTRELSEALKRRCVYLHIDYPTLEAELRVVRGAPQGAGPGAAPGAPGSGAGPAPAPTGPKKVTVRQRDAGLGARPGSAQRPAVGPAYPGHHPLDPAQA